MIVAPNAIDVTTYFKLVDPSSGVVETGLVIANLDATYTRDRAAAVKNDLTALVAVDSAHGDNKGIEVDSTNCPGLYRIDWPDAAFASGVSRVQLCVNGAAIDPAYIEVELLPFQTPITGATVRAVNASDAALALSADLATVDGIADNILVDTAEIGVAGAGLTDVGFAAATLVDIADAILERDIGSGTNAGVLNERTVRAALRFLRNKWAVAAGTLTVKCEDDATTAWTSAMTSDGTAEPVTGSDPT